MRAPAEAVGLTTRPPQTQGRGAWPQAAGAGPRVLPPGPARPTRDARFSDAAVDLAVLRRRAYALRWATLPPDVIPLTAADPDFPVAAEIRAAMKRWIDGGYLGYGPPEGLPEFRAAAADMLRRRKGIAAAPEEVLATNSAAAALELACRALLAPGDEAVVLDPVDFLFARSVETAGGRVLRWPCDPATGAVDFAALEALITPRTRLITLCNPLNPVGKVWSRAELLRLGEIATAHGLWLLSDEIWSDIVFAPARHVALASLGPAIAARTVTVTGLSKSFGLAGCRLGLLHTPDAALFERIVDLSGARSSANGVATLSQVAAIAAWEEGWPWLEAFLAHLEDMRDLCLQALATVPGLRCRAPEGCYVAFADLRGLAPDLDMAALAEDLRERHGVAVVPGLPAWFGPGAAGHLRLCFATSRGILEEGLDRLTRGLRALG